MATPSLIPAGDFRTSYAADTTIFPTSASRNAAHRAAHDGDAAECHRPEWPALAGTATATYLVLRQADLEKPELNDLLTEVPRLGGRLRGYVLTQR